MSSVEQEKAKKSSNNIIVRVNRPVRQVQFSGFKEIYEYTVEHHDPPPESIIREEPEPQLAPTMQITEDELNERVAEAFKQGMVEGQKQKADELKLELKNHYELLQNVARDVVQVKSEFLEKSEEIVLRLAFLVAERIVRTELTTRPDALISNIRYTLSKVSSVENNIIVRLNPADHTTIQSRREALQVPFQELEFIRDERLSPGSCIVETNYSTIDATIETQLHAVEQMLEKGMDDAKIHR